MSAVLRRRRTGCGHKLGLGVVLGVLASAVPFVARGEGHVSPRMLDRFDQQMMDLNGQRQQESDEERRERIARHAQERAERLRDLRAKEARERAQLEHYEARMANETGVWRTKGMPGGEVTIDPQEVLRPQLDQARDSFRRAEGERKEAQRIAWFVDVGLFGDDEVTCGRSPVEDQGSVRVEYALNGMPPLLSAWFKCKEAAVSADTKNFTPIVKPATLAWALGEIACRDQFRLNRRPWEYIRLGEDDVVYSIDPESVNARGGLVAFDLRADDSVLHARGDCRRKRIQLVPDGNWERAAVHSANRDALDFACARIRSTVKNVTSQRR